jgi:hypothetical protein
MNHSHMNYSENYFLVIVATKLVAQLGRIGFSINHIKIVSAFSVNSNMFWMMCDVLYLQSMNL